MTLRRLLVAFLLSLLPQSDWTLAAEPEMNDATFEQLHTMVRRQPGESRWMELDWYPSVWEARKKAAEEGKPIFLMAGSGGAPTAGC